jgi:hypothetical protein
MIQAMIRNFASSAKSTAKSVAESFASVASFHKAKREVDEFHRMQSLSAEPIALNEQNLSLAAGRVRLHWLDGTGKETRAAIHREIACEVEALLQRLLGKTPRLIVTAQLHRPASSEFALRLGAHFYVAHPCRSSFGPDASLHVRQAPG